MSAVMQTGKADRQDACPTVGRLAVGVKQLTEMLGLDDGRTVQAQRKAVWRFVRLHNIKAQPGRVFPLARVRQAISAE